MSGSLHHEIERKFDGHPQRPLSAEGLPGVAAVVRGGIDVLDAVYYDTEGLSLLGHGITLRRREGGDDAGWHLKLPAPDGGRDEIQVPLDEGAAGPPPELLRRTRVYAGGAELRPVLHLRTTRELTLLTDAESRTVAEVAFDHVAARVLDPVTDASAIAPEGAAELVAVPQTELTTWSETEVELAAAVESDDGTALLDAVTDLFAAQGVHPSQASSKAARALGTALPPAALLRQDISAAGPTAEALVGALRHSTDTLLALDQAVRVDEPNAVHRMRTTARRLRSLLTILGRLSDRAGTDPMAAELRWLGQVLGALRDPQTLGERLTSQCETLPAAADPGATAALVRAWTDRSCAAARQELLRAMDSARYFTLVDNLERAAAQPPLPPGRRYGRKAGRRLLRHEIRRIGRRAEAARRLPPGPGRDRALHLTRKAAKRARYGAEGLAPVLGNPGERRVKNLKKIQKHLGRHQDAVAAEQVLTELARTPATTAAGAFACGVLFARQRRRADADVAVAWRAEEKSARA